MVAARSHRKQLDDRPNQGGESISLEIWRMTDVLIIDSSWSLDRIGITERSGLADMHTLHEDWSGLADRHTLHEDWLMHRKTGSLHCQYQGSI